MNSPNTVCENPHKMETEKPKKESPVMKLVRRVKEKFRPTHASVRFDIYANPPRWGVLDDKHEAVRHFEYGVMENVEFSSYQNVNLKGCAGMNVGVATGMLRQDTYGNDSVGYENLSFNGRNFVNAKNEVITRASKLRLLENRRALYKA